MALDPQTKVKIYRNLIRSLDIDHDHNEISIDESILSSKAYAMAKEEAGPPTPMEDFTSGKDISKEFDAWKSKLTTFCKEEGIKIK